MASEQSGDDGAELGHTLVLRREEPATLTGISITLIQNGDLAGPAGTHTHRCVPLERRAK